jgi:hydroxymethylpyrimidine pyrophosphatase-like HAD family hydrolase
MIALDLDGTILGGDFRLSDRTIAAVRAAVRRGVRVSIATGRRPSSAAVYATQLGLREPIIGHQGALIRAMPVRQTGIEASAAPGAFQHRGPVGRVLRHRPMAAATTREAIAWCLANGLDAHVNDLERIVAWRDDPNLEDYSAFLGESPIGVADLEASIRRPVSKVIAVGDDGRPMALIAEARRVFAGRADPTVSHPKFLEFVAHGVSKGWAVGWLAARANIPMGRVLAAGDALNDLEMIAAVGHGAAMATAPAEVRAAARYVARPVEQDGVAALIEALVLVTPAQAARNATRLAEEAAGR